jgi:hypothetical protein
MPERPRRRRKLAWNCTARSERTNLGDFGSALRITFYGCHSGERDQRIRKTLEGE